MVRVKITPLRAEGVKSQQRLVTRDSSHPERQEKKAQAGGMGSISGFGQIIRCEPGDAPYVFIFFFKLVK